MHIIERKSLSFLASAIAIDIGINIEPQTADLPFAWIDQVFQRNVGAKKTSDQQTVTEIYKTHWICQRCT